MSISIVAIADIYKYLMPFLSALLASYVTYILTIRSKKHDILLKEKLSAFKAIMQCLVSLKRCCLSKVAEYRGSEFAQHFDDLPDEDRMSALAHRTKINNIADERLIYLSRISRQHLDDIDKELSLLCSMELLLASNIIRHNNSFARETHLPMKLQEGYEKMIVRIDNVIDILYKEMKMPK